MYGLMGLCTYRQLLWIGRIVQAIWRTFRGIPYWQEPHWYWFKWDQMLVFFSSDKELQFFLVVQNLLKTRKLRHTIMDLVRSECQPIGVYSY